MGKPFLKGAFAAAIVCALVVSADAAGGRLRAVVNGVAIPAARVASIAVDGDTLGFDMATIALEPSRLPPPVIGDDLVVEAVMGGTTTSIFKGEIVGLEPNVAAVSIAVRAFNRLHRLARDRKTRTFEMQSDAQIAAAIAKEAGLEAKTESDIDIRHDHVFQHNQTDLEFLRARASLIGFEVTVDDRTLNFRRRRDLPAVALGCAPTRGATRAFLNSFHPRLAGRDHPAIVTVQGLNSATNEAIDARATRRLVALSPLGAELKNPPGTTLDLGVVQALESDAGAHGAAAGVLAALTALDLSAEADSDGSPALHAGARVSLSQADDRFNGDYFVTGVSHRYQKGSDTGFHTLLRLVRADRGVFVLPEVGDEVLVAFEHGDVARPFVIGSLWDDDTPSPRESPFCEGRRPRS